MSPFKKAQFSSTSTILATYLILLFAILAVPQGSIFPNAAVASAAPIPVADSDTNFGPGVNAANNWNFAAADVCIQELAVVPALDVH
ncbi:hypothetical protein BGZ99_001670, partial [Dissophora globulifera]